MTHGRSDEELDRAAARFETWAAGVDPDEFEATDDLWDVASTADALADAVRTARGLGRSWGRIAIALGVSRAQAERRYGPSDR